MPFKCRFQTQVKGQRIEAKRLAESTESVFCEDRCSEQRKILSFGT